MQFVLLAVICGILGFSGWAFAKNILHEHDGAALLGLTGAMGPVLFVFLSNALGYAMPIRAAFAVTIIVIAAIALGSVVHGWRKKLKTEWPTRSIIILLSVVTVICAAAYVRDRGSDEWSWPHFALPATIVAGNFPIVEPPMPWEPIEYHYGAQMIVAGVSALTGVSFALSQILLPVFATFGMLWLGVALGRKLTGSWGGGAVGGILGFMGGGMFWLFLLPLARDLFQNFILGVPVPLGPFWYLTHSIRNLYAQGFMPMLGHRPTALGGLFLFGFLYAYHESLREKDRRRLMLWLTLAFVFATQMALTIETTFVMLPAAIGLQLLLSAGGLFRSKNSREEWMRILFYSLLIWIPAFLVALHQGGPLTSHTAITGDGGFTFNSSLRLPVDASKPPNTIGVTDFAFWRDYGLHFVLLLAASVWAWRKKGVRSFLFLLCIIGGSHLALPFLIFYAKSPPSMQRLLTVGFSIGSLAVGVFLWETMLSPALKSHNARIRRVIASLLITCMLLAAAFHAPVRLFFPTFRLERTPLLPPMPERTVRDAQLHEWVREHTTLQDRFYMYEDTLHPDHAVRPRMLKDRITFSSYTGRFVIGWGNFTNPSGEQLEDLRAIMNSCDRKGFEDLQIRYVVLPRKDDHEAWFKKCRTRDWVQREYGVGVEEFPKVFERRGL